MKMKKIKPVMKILVCSMPARKPTLSIPRTTLTLSVAVSVARLDTTRRVEVAYATIDWSDRLMERF